MAAAQAEVHVLGVVWKEKGVNAPDGTIIPNPGTVATARAYMIFDQSIVTSTPGPGTMIVYTDNRSRGSGPQRIYTIDSQFRGFNADAILGASGGRRIYGHMFAPTSIADIPGSMIPFSGSVVSGFYPNKIRLDNTVFQTGSSTGVAGPIVVQSGTLLRSMISGNANPVKVASTTIAGATAELEERLIKKGYSRGAVAPVILTDLPPTLAIQDGDTETLSVVLSSSVYPTPTYKWFRDDVQIATTPTFNVVGGSDTTGAGTYRVEVSTSAGTAVSGETIVTPLQYTFATDLPPTTPIAGANTAELSVVLDPAPITTPTYQWFKGTTPIPAGIGGTSPAFTVIGGEAATGAGVYKVEVTSTAGIATSASTTVTVAAPAANVLAFTTNAPRTATPTFAGTVTLNVTIANPGTNPTFRWSKAPLSDPTAFEPVEVGDGGHVEDLIVRGDNDHPNGPGVYRLVVTRTQAPAATITSISTVVTTAP